MAVHQTLTLKHGTPSQYVWTKTMLPMKLFQASHHVPIIAAQALHTPTSIIPRLCKGKPS